MDGPAAGLSAAMGEHSSSQCHTPVAPPGCAAATLFVAPLPAAACRQPPLSLFTLARRPLACCPPLSAPQAWLLLPILTPPTSQPAWPTSGADAGCGTWQAAGHSTAWHACTASSLQQHPSHMVPVVHVHGTDRRMLGARAPPAAAPCRILLLATRCGWLCTSPSWKVGGVEVGWGNLGGGHGGWTAGGVGMGSGDWVGGRRAVQQCPEGSTALSRTFYNPSPSRLSSLQAGWYT